MPAASSSLVAARSRWATARANPGTCASKSSLTGIGGVMVAVPPFSFAVMRPTLTGSRPMRKVHSQRENMGHSHRLLVPDRRGEPGDRSGVSVARGRGVADDQRGSAGVLAQRVVTESLDGHAAGRRVGDDLAFWPATGQLNDRVQAGRDPGEVDAGRVPGER